jgi:hypothetical protein
MPLTAVDRAVRSARRRLFAQALLGRLLAGWAVALGLALAWFLAEPLLIDSPPGWMRWAVLGGLVGLATLAAIVRSARRAPSRLDSALELDARFGLRERVTTAVGLPDALRTSAAGRAVVADAEKHASELKVRDKFPVGMSRRAAGLPALAGLIAAVAFLYHPVTDSEAWAEAKKNRNDPAAEKRVADAGKRPAYKPADRKEKPAPPDRADKSAKLKELEADLDRLEREAREAKPDPDAAREKVTEVTAAEEKAKAFEREKQDRLARLEQKLQQLDRLSAAEDFQDGPAKDFNDALAKGDLKKAEEAADELRKKAKDKTLDPKEAAQLGEQLDRMKDELQRLASNQEQQDKLKELIDKAKNEGRDAESLERELDRLKAEAGKSQDLQQLADKLGRAKEALKGADLEEVAKQLERVAGQLRELQGEVKDLEDVQEHLQRLKDLKDGVAGRTAKGGSQPGEGQPGDGQPGEGQAGSQPGGKGGKGDNRGQPGGKSDNATGAGVASGARPDNPDAATKRGADERQRTPFDPRGRKVYAGASPGPSFTKRSPTELGATIDRAVQEAPDALATQPLPRDDKEAVKEYFRDLGNKK